MTNLTNRSGGHRSTDRSFMNVPTYDLFLSPEQAQKRLNQQIAGSLNSMLPPVQRGARVVGAQPRMHNSGV